MPMADLFEKLASGGRKFSANIQRIIETVRMNTYSCNPIIN